MITQKKIKIPIFNYKLTIIIYDNWSEVSHLFDDGPEPKAITYNQYGASLVAVNVKYGSSIVHEAEHVKTLYGNLLGIHHREIMMKWMPIFLHTYMKK